MAEPQVQQQQAFDPVKAIQSILQGERKPAPEVKVPETPQSTPQAAPQAEVQPEAETPPSENAQVEGADAEDAPKTLEIPEDQLDAVEIEVKEWSKDGQRKLSKRTIKELREGYMRLDDYSRNIQDVARQRDEVPQKVREAIESEKKQYVEQLTQLDALVLETAASELKGVNWNDLAANDPAKYVQLRNRADQLQQARSSIQSKLQEFKSKAETEAREARLKAARESRAQLERDIPGFNDDLYQKILKAGDKYGFRTEETAEWVDPRAIKVLHALYQYDQLKPGNPAEKKVVIPPKAVKPGPGQTVTADQQKAAEALKRLQKSGTIEDAAAVIRSRL